MNKITAETARKWIGRWDEQQMRYLPNREDYFTALFDAADAVGLPENPMVIDLGCGPGSLSIRFLERFPDAEIVAVDNDPVLLTLAQTAWSDITRLRFVDANFSQPGWTDRLALSRPVDVAISTTALHWLPASALDSLYGELVAKMRPGAILLNGDELPAEEEDFPLIAKIEIELINRAIRRRSGDVDSESWDGWWDSIQSEPTLSDAHAERVKRGIDGDHHQVGTNRLRDHVGAMKLAGFAQVRTIWHVGPDHVLCGVVEK